MKIFLSIFIMLCSLAYSQGEVIAGASHTMIKKYNGELFAFGDNWAYQTTAFTSNQIYRQQYGTQYPYIKNMEPVIFLNDGKLVPVMDADKMYGRNTSFFINSSGSSFGYGGNWSGLVGISSDSEYVQLPTQINGFNFVEISIGSGHALGLTADGLVYAWGAGYYGKLGLGDTEDREIPTLIPGLENVVQIAAGGYHSLAILSNGDFYGWGFNGWNNIPNLSYQETYLSPTYISSNNVQKVVAYSSHTVTGNGSTIQIYGYHRHPGGGSSTYQNGTNFNLPTGYSDFTTGGGFTLALLPNGTVYAGGENGKGQLGDGTLEHRGLPQQVLGLENIVSISAGSQHAIAVDNNGNVLKKSENLTQLISKTSWNNLRLVK